MVFYSRGAAIVYGFRDVCLSPCFVSPIRGHSVPAFVGTSDTGYLSGVYRPIDYSRRKYFMQFAYQWGCIICDHISVIRSRRRSDIYSFYLSLFYPIYHLLYQFGPFVPLFFEKDIGLSKNFLNIGAF